VSASFRGHKTYSNEATPLVNEYSQRLRLHKLGYVSDVESLSVFKVDAFCMISAEIDRLNDEEMKKKQKKAKSKRR